MRAIRSVLPLAVLFVLLPAAARAQTISTWTGGGSDNNWSTSGNWSGAGVPSGDTGDNVVVFSGTSRPNTVNDLNNWSRSFGQMYFASGAASFTLSGNTFGFRPYLGSGTQQIIQNSANTQTIGVNEFSFRNAANSQINLNAGDLVISSPSMYIDASSSTVRSLVVTGNDSTRRTVTFAGNVNKGDNGNDPDMYIQGNKRVLVTGSLTFGSGNDGSVFVDDGVLQFSIAGTMTGGRPVIGSTGGSGNAAVWLDTAGSTFARQLEVRNGSSGRRTIGGLNTSGTTTFSGDFVGGTDNFDLAAATGGAANFTGTRNFTSTLHVNRPDGATTYGGTVILSGTTNSTGGVGVYGGTLQFSDFNQLGSGYFGFEQDTGDSGTLRYTGGSTSVTKQIWSNKAGQTRAAIDVSQAGTTLAWTQSGGDFNRNLTKVGAGTLAFNGPITGAGGNVAVEAGMLILTGSNSYAGGTVVSGGTLEVSANGSQGGSPAGLGTGTVSIASGGQVKYWLSLGSSNTVANPFSLSGGTLHTTDGYNTYSGRVTLASGASTISAQYEDVITLSGGLAGSGNVLFTQSGGTGSYAAPTYVLSGTGANTGTVRVNGSSGGSPTKLQLANVNALQSATLDMAAGDTGTVEFIVAGNNTYNVGGLQGSRNLAYGSNALSIGGNNQSTTYSGTLSGSGNLTKTGSGRLALTGANTFTGTTSVAAGELTLNGSLASGLGVLAGATISGTGTVGGNTTIAGIHSPGNSPGIQTFAGNLTYEPGAVVEWELIANTTGSAGTNYDQIILPSGNLTFSGSTTLALSFNSLGSTVNWSDAFWDDDRAWMIYDLSGGLTTGLSNLTIGGSLLDSVGNSLSPTTRGYFTTTRAGQDVMLAFVAVPEPSTLALTVIGSAALGLATRRRRTRMLVLLIASLLLATVGRSPVAAAADNFWTGGASTGDFSDNANWNSPPSWGFGNSLVFQTNTSAPTLTNNQTWRDNNDIFWNTAFPVARTLQSTGNFGLGFKVRLENLSSFTQTVTMPLSGGLDNAGQIQLNPVNGSLVLDGFLYNDNSVDYVVFGSQTATVTNLTLNTALGPNATQANIDFTVAGGRNSAIQVNASQLWAGTTDVQSGSFTTGTGVTLASTAILVSGGTVATTSANTFADSATLTVNTGRLSIGGSDTVGSLAGSGGTVDLAAGATLTAGGANTNTSYAGSIGGSGNLTKLGSGRLALTGANTFTGTTSVAAGELKLNGSLAGGLSVVAGATISGTGTVGGNATIAGLHSPGNSPGIQTFNGNLTYEPGAVVEWELIANTTGSAGTNYDQIILPSGNLTFSGSTTLALSFNSLGSTVNWSDAFWDDDRAWMIYDLSGGLTTGLSNLTIGGSLLDSVGNSLSPTTRGYFTTIRAGQDVMLAFVAVPEPSTWAMALAGLSCGSLLLRRRPRA